MNIARRQVWVDHSVRSLLRYIKWTRNTAYLLLGTKMPTLFTILNRPSTLTAFLLQSAGTVVRPADGTAVLSVSCWNDVTVTAITYNRLPIANIRFGQPTQKVLYHSSVISVWPHWPTFLSTITEQMSSSLGISPASIAYSPHNVFTTCECSIPLLTTASNWTAELKSNGKSYPNVLAKSSVWGC